MWGVGVKDISTFSKKEKMHLSLGLILIPLFGFQLYWMTPALFRHIEASNIEAVIKLGLLIPIVFFTMLYFAKQTYDKLK